MVLVLPFLKQLAMALYYSDKSTASEVFKLLQSNVNDILIYTINGGKRNAFDHRNG